jgi:hypothetical protein
MNKQQLQSKFRSLRSKSKSRRVSPRTKINRGRRRGLPRGMSNTMVPYSLSGVESVFSRTSVTPDRTFVRLRFLETPYQTGNLTGATLYVDKYALNAVYDPYLGSGGTQPSGFAEMFNQYQWCRVWGSTITVRVTRVEHQSDSPYEICIVPIPYGATPTPPSSLKQYVEQPYASYSEGVSVYADAPHVIRKRMDVCRLMGVPPYSLAEAGYIQNDSANTANICQWHVVLLQPNSVVSNTALQLSVEIIYDCEFFNRTANPSQFVDRLLREAKTSGKLAEMRAEASVPIKPIPRYISTDDDSKDFVVDETSIKPSVLVPTPLTSKSLLTCTTPPATIPRVATTVSTSTKTFIRS